MFELVRYFFSIFISSALAAVVSAQLSLLAWNTEDNDFFCEPYVSIEPFLFFVCIK